VQSEYSQNINKDNFSAFSINSSLRSICYDVFLGLDQKKAHGKVIANLLSAEYEGILKPELVVAINFVFTFLTDQRDRKDFLIAINILSKVDHENRKHATNSLIEYCNIAQKIESKVNREVIKSLLNLTDSDHALVVANAFKCLGCIVSKKTAISFIKKTDLLFSINSKNKSREVELLEELIPILALKKALFKLDLPHYLKLLENLLKNKGTSIEAQKKRVDILNKELSSEDLIANLKIVNILDSYKKLDKNVLDLLDSSHLRSFIEIITNLEKEEDAVNALNIFKVMIKFSLNPTLNDFYTKVLQQLKEQVRTQDAISQIKANLDLGMPIELAFVYPIFNNKLEFIKDVFYQEYGNDNKFNDFLKSVAAFAVRNFEFNNQTLYVTLEVAINNIHEIIFSSSSYNKEILAKLVLVLNAECLPENEGIYGLSQLILFLKELKAHYEISQLLHLENIGERQEIHNKIIFDFNGDNPPFSLETALYKDQIRFQSQIYEIFIRQEDPHYGFWSDTYNFRHTPVGSRCLFDEIITNVFNANLYIIPSKNIAKFPGRGRIVTDIDLSNLVGYDSNLDAWNKTFVNYGHLVNSKTEFKLDLFNLLSSAQITHLRAFEAYSVPSNSAFTLEGVNLTLIIWNQHFDSNGAQILSLVPTVALKSFFKDKVIPFDLNYDDYRQINNSNIDISSEPPTLRALKARCEQMNLPIGVINVTSGSCFFGGFCNGFEVASSPYHIWERANNSFLDGFRHSHKYHVRTNNRILKELHNVHEKLYEITASLLNIRDSYKILYGLACRDHFENGDQTQIKYGKRVLNYFFEFYDNYSQLSKKDSAPVLVLAPINKAAFEVDGPIVLDGLTGYAFSEWSKPFEIFESNGQPSSEIIDFWSNYVDYWLDQEENLWHAPRLIARENAQELIRILSKSK
jgi:hypothetical protein